MLAYHGTTRLRARNIFKDGFLPKPPSRRVWFAESRGYAMGRAKTQARRANDQPVVLACELDINGLRRKLGTKKVVHRKQIIAIDGRVPVGVLLSYPFADMATVPEEVVDWVNGILGLSREESVRKDHPGVIRLSRWINSHLASDPEKSLLCSELLEKAKRWLPEYFAGLDLDADSLQAHRRLGLISYEVDPRVGEPDPREAEALDYLEGADPEERVRGLKLLAEIHDPDLFDWCTMFIDDEAEPVQIAALRIMFQCKDVQPDLIEPYAVCEQRRVRAAAIAVLARHAGQGAPRWVKRGLKDPEICVRVEAARFLRELDPHDHRAIFELARNDPHTDVARRANDLLPGRRAQEPQLISGKTRRHGGRPVGR
ncbi:MAG: hypothetical protein QF473_06565 [Planctomycetota bacterium]|nr:hypothetical protein [Planctomycetota bacterium]MDP6504070.1 hypothetical protein [Planctomycetota bacterium]